MNQISQEEQKRLEALYKYEILDTPEERDFDRLSQLASMICETPISLITLLDHDRQWFKSKHGIEINETHRNVAFCNYAIMDDKMLVVKDATKDERFKDNPFVTSAPEIRFYAGMPLITPDGFRLGTLCVIDDKPRELTEFQKFAVETLASEVITQLELRLKMKQVSIQSEELKQNNTSLKRINDSNGKLLSIIAHDLRSPISSISSLIDMYQSADLSNDEMKELTLEMKSEVVNTSHLLDNLLQWAVSQFKDETLRPVEINLLNLSKEAGSIWEERIRSKSNKLIYNIDESLSIISDENYLKFIIRNLINNANKFTSKGIITISARESDEKVFISVSDTGIGMTEDQMSKLFNWEQRSSLPGTDGEKGTGLGLQVCYEFAKKLEGEIHVKSKVGEGSEFEIELPKILK